MFASGQHSNAETLQKGQLIMRHKKHFWKLVGALAFLGSLTVVLLGLSLAVQPTAPAWEANPRLVLAPVAARAQAEGTPEPVVAVQVAPHGSSDGNCALPLSIACGQQDSRDNTGYNSEHNVYSCKTDWNESGPEVIYRFTLAAGHNYTVTATLTNTTADLDVFLLSTSDCATGGCLAVDSYGDTKAVAGNVPPGTYYIAVDGYEGDRGLYTLDLTCDSVGGNNPPNKPSDPSPADGATGVDLKPRLGWIGGDPDGDSVHYTVWGGQTSWMTSTMWYSGSNSFFTIDTPLKPNTKYVWNVVAKDAQGATTSGDFWEFTTSTKLFLPLVLKKVGGAAPGPTGVPPTATHTPSSTPTPTATTSPTPTQTPENKTATRFTNYTPYLIISLRIDGIEYINSEADSIPSNYYVEKNLAVGTHSLEAYNGWWDKGNRVSMYYWSGSFQQQLNHVTFIDFTGPPIEKLLPDFQTSRYWRGEYWTGDPVSLHYAAFCFYDNNTFRFYLDGNQDDTGTYAELYRSPGLVTFRATNTAGTESFDGILDEIDGSFMMGNGPPDWKNIKYIPDDTVNCPPAP